MASFTGTCAGYRRDCNHSIRRYEITSGRRCRRSTHASQNLDGRTVMPLPALIALVRLLGRFLAKFLVSRCRECRALCAWRCSSAHRDAGYLSDIHFGYVWCLKPMDVSCIGHGCWPFKIDGPGIRQAGSQAYITTHHDRQQPNLVLQQQSYRLSALHAFLSCGYSQPARSSSLLFTRVSPLG